MPVGFNAARSGTDAVHDYWDLTLIKIRKWYYADNSEKDTILKTLLHDKTDNTMPVRENCSKWLDWFRKEAGRKTDKNKRPYDGWHYFVDTLLMQDYIWNEEDGIDKDDKKYYEVKPFWLEHDWNHPGFSWKDDHTVYNE